VHINYVSRGLITQVETFIHNQSCCYNQTFSFNR